IAGSSAAWITMTVARTGAASGSDRGASTSQIFEKPVESGGLFAFAGRAEARENLSPFAGHWGVALLNDALLRRLSGPVRAHSSVGRAADSESAGPRFEPWCAHQDCQALRTHR